MNRILILQILVFAAVFAGCDVKTLGQKSLLPQTMPQDFEARYIENGGFAPKHKSIRLDGNTLYVETKAFDAPKRIEQFAEVSEADKQSLYKAFVDNEFDKITYETTDVYTSDAIIRSISLRASGKSYSIQSDPNKPLSELNSNRFKNVLSAIQNLENKYQKELKEFDLEYSVLKIEPESLRFISKSAKPAELNNNDIETAKFFAKDAVFRDNDNAKYKRDLLPIKSYKFQFVPFTDEKGVKNVYVNAFCSETGTDWKNDLVMVSDGGSCYFNFKINLKNSTIYDFAVNGEA